MQKLLSFIGTVAFVIAAVFFTAVPDVAAYSSDRYHSWNTETNDLYWNYWYDQHRARTYDYQTDPTYNHPYEIRTGIYRYRKDYNRWKDRYYRDYGDSNLYYKYRIRHAELDPYYRKKFPRAGVYDQWDQYSSSTRGNYSTNRRYSPTSSNVYWNNSPSSSRRCTHIRVYDAGSNTWSVETKSCN